MGRLQNPSSAMAGGFTDRADTNAIISAQMWLVYFSPKAVGPLLYTDLGLGCKQCRRQRTDGSCNAVQGSVPSILFSHTQRLLSFKMFLYQSSGSNRTYIKLFLDWLSPSHMTCVSKSI